MANTENGIDINALFSDISTGAKAAIDTGIGLGTAFANAMNSNPNPTAIPPFDPNSRINMNQNYANYNPYQQPPAYNQPVTYGYGYGSNTVQPTTTNMAYPGISNDRYGMM